MSDWWNPFDDYDEEKKAAIAPETDPNNYRLGGDGGPSGRRIFEQYGTMGNLSQNRQAQQADYGDASAMYGYAGGTVGQGISAMGGDAAAAGDQRALAGQLQARAAGTTGPSLAELSMGRQADDAMAANLSMAAGGSGPSNTAALINAQNRNAMQSGQLVRDVGIQRAAEQQQAEQALGGVLSAERAGTVNAAGTYGALGGQQMQIGQQFQGQADANTDRRAQQGVQNDAQQLGLLGFGYQAYKDDSDARIQRDTNEGNWEIGAASNRIAAQQADNAAGAGITQTIGSLMAMSDISAKKDVVVVSDSADVMNTNRKSGEEKSGLASMFSDVRSKENIVGASPSSAYMTPQKKKEDGKSGNGMAAAGAAMAMFSDVRSKSGVSPASEGTWKRLNEADARDKSFDGAADAPWYQRAGWAITGRQDELADYRKATGAREDAVKARTAHLNTIQPEGSSPYQKQMLEAMRNEAYTSSATERPYSDLRSKDNVDPMQADISDTFRELGSYGYDYKDPKRHGEGRFYGPMAQELAATPAGRTAVLKGPDGKLAVDPGRLALTNASETGNLRRELDDMKARLDAVGETRASEIYATGSAEYPEGFGYEAPRERVAPTDLIYDQRSESFRTPDEQLRYSRALGGDADRLRGPPPTKLFVDDEAGVMRTPLEQYEYQAGLQRNADRDARIARGIYGAERDARSAMTAPTRYPEELRAWR